MGDFITAQVIADTKYVEPLRSARDWWTYAASGPGSRRGLNLIFDRPIGQRWDELNWRHGLRKLQDRTRPMFEAAGMEVPHAQDLQNCLFEWSKYERARLGGSMPKRRFRPNDEGL
jgi:alpha-glutamyl/putrescinyl thymine pyrophosphorylase clade 1